MANGADEWKTVKMEALSHDSSAGVMVISEELAKRLFESRRLWRNISPRTVTDDLGCNHICQYSIEVRYCWNTDNRRTKGATLYVSSQLKRSVRSNDGNVMATVDLLVPSDAVQFETTLAHAVFPNYHLPRQTKGM